MHQVDSIRHFFGVYKLLELCNCLWKLFIVVEIKEALHGGSLYYESRVVFQSVSFASQRVVVTDSTTHYNPTFVFDMHEQIVKHLPSHIVEIDIDSTRKVLF